MHNSDDEKLEEELKSKEEELVILREEQAKLRIKKVFSIKRYLNSKIDSIGLDKASTLSPDELLYLITKKSISPFRRDLQKYGFSLKTRPKSPHDITDEGATLVASVVSGMLEDEDNNS